MQHDILYKRAKTGKIISYEIRVDTETTDDLPVIIKTTGQLEGKKTIHTETVFEGKNIGKSNETTPVQQAVSQAESDWKKKKDEGYKSFLDLGVKDISELEEKLTQFNTDSSGQAKPMLAIDWKKVKSVTYPCLIQPKLDGVRCLMVVDSDKGKLVKFLSRSGKEYTTLDHIEKQVVGSVLNRSLILDGEVYSDELSFQEIISAVKKQRADSLKLRFRAYDIINDSDQKQRWIDTKEIVETINSEYIQLVDTHECKNEESVKEYHNFWVQNGYEGAMLRLYSGLYGQGQRSRDLLKVKEFDEQEFMCLELIKGQREEDVIAVCKTEESKTFNVKLVGTREYKADLVKNWDNKPKPLTVKHFGWTDSNLPRFPVGKAFRDY